jgi:hypothetical protein
MVTAGAFAGGGKWLVRARQRQAAIPVLAIWIAVARTQNPAAQSPSAIALTGCSRSCVALLQPVDDRLMAAA